MQPQAHAEQRGIANPAAGAKPGQRSKHQTTRTGGHSAAPVAVHPLAQGAEFGDCQQTARERPGWCGPGPEHPIAERAHRRHRQHHSRPGKARRNLSQRQDEALAGRKDGTVSGLLEDVDAFEELVKRMGRIRQAQVGERVAQEDVAEVVGAGRVRDRMLRE